jgi:hypothetical protein
MTDPDYFELSKASVADANVPAKIPRIYILLSTGIDNTSALIRWYTNSDISHALIAWWNSEFDTVMTLGAQSNGLTVETLDTFLAAGNVIKYVFTAPGLWVGARKNRDLIDCPYDYYGLIGMGAVEAWQHWTKSWINNPLSSKRALFCSAYAQKICIDSGYSVAAYLQPNQVSPATLVDTLKTMAPPWRQATVEEIRSNSVFGVRAPS